MTHEICIRIGAVSTLERHNSSTWNRAGRTLYERGSLRFAPARCTVPLLVDHLDDRVIGEIVELFTMDWTDGPWICGRGTVTKAPDWLKRGTKASFRESVYQRRGPDFGPARFVVGALVGELSVLSPGVAPAEPLADVLSYRPAKPELSRSIAAVGSAAATGDRIFYGKPGDVIRRPCGGQVLAIR